MSTTRRSHRIRLWTGLSTCMHRMRTGLTGMMWAHTRAVHLGRPLSLRRVIGLLHSHHGALRHSNHLHSLTTRMPLNGLTSLCHHDHSLLRVPLHHDHPLHLRLPLRPHNHLLLLLLKNHHSGLAGVHSWSDLHSVPMWPLHHAWMA